MENLRSTEVSVVSVTGDVIVVNAQGEERLVKAGEAILPGEMIITPVDGDVSLNTGKAEPESVPADTAAFLEIDPATGEVVLVFQAMENEGLDIAAIQEAILQGQDPTEILESAAAGQVSREGFSSFQMVARTADEVIAEAGYDTSTDPREFDEVPTFDGENRPARPDIGIPDLNGSLVGSNSIAEDAQSPVSGSFVLNAPGGVRDVTVDGNVITEQQLLDLQSGTGTIPPITTSDESGTLTITGYDAATGTVTYSYQVSGTKDHSAGDSSVVDNISLSMTDKFGQPSQDSSVDILITDTVPSANDDSANTGEDTPVTVNVLANDIQGADGAKVVGASVPA
ncbi:MAG: retention module-containing protein, partial [Amphritea sp.]|nr:retention module-containing protein [Amphritea sp.]